MSNSQKLVITQVSTVTLGQKVLTVWFIFHDLSLISGVPRWHSNRHSGLANLPSVGAIP